jgi:hypothetical protein
MRSSSSSWTSDPAKPAHGPASQRKLGPMKDLLDDQEALDRPIGGGTVPPSPAVSAVVIPLLDRLVCEPNRQDAWLL